MTGRHDSAREPDTRPLFVISIAAQLAGMHPQTLRVWERRGLLSPRRTARNIRLYSEADIALLRRIQELGETGLNLAGVERVLDLERRLARAERRAAALEAELAERVREAQEELERIRRSGRADLVPVVPPGPPAHRYKPVVRTT
jgi:MerR family transcriptional regulator/heat shock protein HspR